MEKTNLIRNSILSLIYIILSDHNSYAQQNEIGTFDAVDNLYIKSQSSDPNDRVIWSSEEETKLPVILENYFKDAECKNEMTNSTPMSLPYAKPEQLASKSTKGSLVCQISNGNFIARQKYTLCFNPSIVCTGSLIKIRKENVIYMIPEGANCNSVSPRNALLNSFHANYGDFNVLPK